MAEPAEELDGVAETLDWTPWGRPRKAERGVETAFHHPLVMIRARGGADISVVAPGDVAESSCEVEWSPMIWALRGRRNWQTLTKLGPGAVFHGRDDRLFHIANAVCEQLFEGGVLGAKALDGWVTALARRIAYCESRDIVYRLLVVPDAHAVYADAIPGTPRLSEDRPLMQILRRGGDSLRERVVYPLEEMIAGRKTFDTSHPHDVHFTGFGCFLCYRALITALPGVDPAHVVREEDLRLRKILLAGDVARSVGARGRRVDFHEAPAVKYKFVLKGTTFNNQQVDVLESEDVSLPTAVLFRTSNSTHLFPYLMRHFSRLVAVASINVYYDLVESERPHVVLSEMPERYFAPLIKSVSETDLGSHLHDADDDFETATGHKLPLPRGDATPPAI